jgi:phosphomannomutase
VSGGAIFAEMAVKLRDEGKTVLQQLQSLYDRYGEFVSYNSYIICRDPKKTDAIFARIRSGGPTGSYFTEVAGVGIVAVKDITIGYDSTTTDFACDLPTTPDSHMLMFTFANGVTATFRTSGTEPKIKFYTEIAGKVGDHRDELEAILHSFVDQVVSDFLQPQLNGLV